MIMGFDPSKLDALIQGASGNLAAPAQAVTQNRLAQIAARKLSQQQSKFANALAAIQQAQSQYNLNGLVYRGGTSSPPASTMPMPKGSLKQWINAALMDTGHTGGAHDKLAAGLYQMIMHESGGNPTAQNNWDSNAKAGTPSIGLMQTIQPTFNSYALQGHKNIYNPVDNIIAGLRYALSRYGMGMVEAGGRHDAAGNYIGY